MVATPFPLSEDKPALAMYSRRFNPGGWNSGSGDDRIHDFTVHVG